MYVCIYVLDGDQWTRPKHVALLIQAIKGSLVWWQHIEKYWNVMTLRDDLHWKNDRIAWTWSYRHYGSLKHVSLVVRWHITCQRTGICCNTALITSKFACLKWVPVSVQTGLIIEQDWIWNKFFIMYFCPFSRLLILRLLVFWTPFGYLFCWHTQ